MTPKNSDVDRYGNVTAGTSGSIISPWHGYTRAGCSFASRSPRKREEARPSAWPDATFRPVLRVPRQVLVYLFRRSGDGAIEFLLLKRTEQWGGFWQGVSGAPEWEESDVEGAVREVREETGFEVSDTLKAIDYRYELRRECDLDGDRWTEIYGPDVHAVPEEVYLAEVLDGHDPVLAPYEHDDFRWCSYEEALALLRWENNRQALVASREFIELTGPVKSSRAARSGRGRQPQAEMDAARVVDLLAQLRAADISVWLDGGWGIDALLERQTRPHDDLDLVAHLDDTARIQRVLGAHGYELSAGGAPFSYELVDELGHQVDVHPVSFGQAGEGRYRMADGSDWIYAADAFTGTGCILGHEMPCLTPEVMMVNHTAGYGLDEDHQRDVAALGARYGIPVPEFERI